MLSCWEWDAAKRPTFKHLEKKLESEVDWSKRKNDDPLLSRIDNLHEIDQSSYKREIEIKTANSTAESEIPPVEDRIGQI